ncbi:Uma2 family endonuclease [Streptomyces sp. NPDC057424]|uniref:Uma2 family endonuclease n=1 Tax=Streptomyces sp. NPDC057424 TaxID=3346127 RepID=UPI0036B5EF66
MTAIAHEPLSQEDVLLEGFLALDTPEGFRAELIEGEIVVTPPPDGDHEKCISRIVRQVIRYSRTDMDFSGNKGLKVRSGGSCPKNHLVPDVTFGPIERDLFGGVGSWMSCDGVAMVMEVTSTRPPADREAKRHCYARAGIPLYLLVDRDTAQVTVFSEPKDDDYREHCARPFGKPIALPEPFAFDLDTADLL